MKLFKGLAFLCLCQCGYNWGQGNRHLPGGHKTVYVEMFDNNSSEVGAEASFTQALTQSLERSGFAIVSTKDSAELHIKGTILDVLSLDSLPANRNFYKNNYVTDAQGNVTSTSADVYTAHYFTVYNMRVSANLQAVRTRDKQMIWQTSLSGEKSYRGSVLKKDGIRSSNVLYNQSQRKQTMELIAKDMMQEAFDRLTENF